jgi:hypothetical protein
MPDPRENRLLQALKRRFRTPRDALKALGLDTKLLDPPRKRLAYGPRLAVDGKPRPARDEDPEEVNEALRDFVSKLDPDQMAVLFQMLEEQMNGMAPLDDDELTEDDPEPVPGMPKPGGGMVPSRQAAQDASFGTARIGQAMGTVTMAERRIIQKAEDRRRPRLAQDARQAMRRAPSGYDMFPSAARIKPS